MSERTCLSVILAAGEGTRMKSNRSKVLHEIAGLPMAAHVVRAAARSGAGEVALVVGRDADSVRAAVAPFAPNAETYLQAERLGTAHAVLAARAALEKGHDDVLVMFGDTPLIDPADLTAARQKLADGAHVVVMGFRAADPAGYGRLIVDNGELVAIREDRDASDTERAIDFCNGGLMAISGAYALALLDAVGNDNAKGEYYLTDIVAIAREQGLSVVATEVAFESVLGINNRVELAEAERIWQQRRRRQAMLDGVTLQAPDTVFFCWDTEIAAETVIEPNVVFGPGVTITGPAVIHAFSHLEGADIGAGASVGPFARLRPGAELQARAKVGNFCEVKKAVIGEGAKVNHLTYVGDAEVGPGANIGAGTITCNYDGYNKHITRIGAGAFIGSNSALVAPVAIGTNAYVASGSVVTDDVPDDAVAFARGRQHNKPGLATRLRERFAAEKAAKKKT
ncbi:bifunctional UDP-N-acetylglucosamine diphosphorylase/glucosamine-1-phosphate N-acetyltransferase GlmU [Zhengella sp. ZM62]|uniref:bifunctional UDP-N-acetylglucosamine diphosphorylase/glucosamine-1-phosphate N-acetyltransferase GlmU n=1 Tax=Zhengella sedimenti TaxID=3390035 RepID=UPI003976EE05